jgi:hypothetical protein
MRLLQDREWFRTACIFAGLLCLLALLPLPMLSFFKVVRVVVCATGIWAALAAYGCKETMAAVIFAAIALLFNPFRQIDMPLEMWRGTVVVSAILFFLASRRLDPSSLARQETSDTIDTGEAH